MSLVRIVSAGVSATALAISLALATPVAAQQEWGIEASDVDPDPAVTYGVLANGMRYAIRHNETPAGTASFRLHIDFGSLGESDDERGLAHFIEHMAFNGSTNVPEGEMIPLLERLGLAFGPDTNAYTSFDETVYMLDVPNANAEGIDTALFLMRETASELTFDSDAVDREREVLISERRLRDTAGLRNFRDLFEFRIPGTRYVTNFPIGEDAVIREAPAERLRALYRRFYRPENATFVAVGDFDVAKMEAMIAERFGDWRAQGEAGTTTTPGAIDFSRAAAFDTFVDPTFQSSVSITQLRPYTDPEDTIAERRRSQLTWLARTIFNRRIQRIANREDSPILGGQFVIGDDVDVADYSSVELTTRDGMWAEGLAIAEQELRRALRYGFTPSELEYALTQTDSALRRGAQQAGARTNAQLASELVNQATENDFVTDPAWRYRLFEQMRPQLTLDAVNARFRELWSEGEPLVRVTAKELDGGVDAVAAAYAASRALAVAEPEDVPIAVFAYDSWGDAPGEVVSDSSIADLGIRTVRFANNVRLNVKQSDFEPGRVRFSVRMDGGAFAVDDINPTAAALYLQFASDVGGLGQHSFDEITEVLAGRQVATGIGADTEAFVSSGTTTADDLPMQMKVSAAYLTDIGLRPEADARYNAIIEAIWDQIMAQPLQVFNLRSSEQLSTSRYTAFPSLAQLGEVDREALRDIIAKAASAGAIEIGIVGDIDPDFAIDAVAQSFGALPMRDAEFADYSQQRTIELRDLSGDEVTELAHTGQADQAVVGSIWLTDDDDDFREETGLRLLGSVLELMATKTLREELAATYSPSVGASSSDDFVGYGSVSLAAVVEPAQVDEVLRIIAQLAGDLRDAPIDDDLLLRARQPLLENIRLAREKNDFWLNVAATAQSEADRLDRVREEIAVLQSLTPADIQRLARNYLVASRRADMRILPEAAD